jgi:hypothetical protein
MVSVFTEVKEVKDKNIENIVCTKSNSFGLDSAGSVYYWGLNPSEGSLSRL